MTKHIYLIALVSVLTTAGCEVGDAPSIGAGTPDASNHVDPGDAAVTPDRDAPESADDGGAPGIDASACTKIVSNPLTDGHHNPGQDCMNSCHNHGFTLAGTLFTSAAGSTPISGGTITVTDAAGATITMVSATNGNFYASQTIAFPITVTASACPALTPMTAAITSGNGGCNKSGCHAAGGAQGYIHLP